MKTKTIFTVWSVLFFGLLFTACNPQEQALNELQEFTAYLEQNSKMFSPDQWNQSIMQYDEICRTIAEYDCDYTSVEQEMIGRYKGKCQAIFTKHAIEEGVDGFIRDLYQYKGLFEGVLEGFNEVLEDYQNSNQ